MFLTEARLDKAEQFFRRHGGKVVTIARFIEGLRQANGIVAGVARMHWLRFLAFNLLGAALWCAVWVSVGYEAGSRIDVLYSQFQRYEVYIGIAAAVLVVALTVRTVVRHRRSSQRGEAPHADMEVERPETGPR